MAAQTIRNLKDILKIYASPVAQCKTFISCNLMDFGKLNLLDHVRAIRMICIVCEVSGSEKIGSQNLQINKRQFKMSRLRQFVTRWSSLWLFCNVAISHVFEPFIGATFWGLTYCDGGQSFLCMELSTTLYMSNFVNSKIFSVLVEWWTLNKLRNWTMVSMSNGPFTKLL